MKRSPEHNWINGGSLVEQLRAEGLGVMLDPVRDRELMSKWRDIKVRNPGLYYRCGPCNAEVSVRKSSRGGYEIARRPHSVHDHEACPHRRPYQVRKAWSVDDCLDSLFGDGPCLEEEMYLRLRGPAQGCAQAIGPLLDALPARADRADRKRRARHSLLGFLGLLTELGRYNCWCTERRHATTFQELMPALNLTLGRSRAMRLLGPLLSKLVLPESASDFDFAIDAAMQAASPQPQLTGKAIVVGRMYRIGSANGKLEITITGMRSSRLTTDAPLWEGLCRSFGTPPLPSSATGKEALTIAIVSREGNELRIHEAAWMPIDHYGIGSESEYEFRTALQLQEAGYAFIKGVHTQVRVGRGYMRVDFLVRSLSGWLILEVDPHGSARSKASKRRRIARCHEAEVPCICFDPVQNIDVRVALPHCGPIRPSGRQSESD